MDSPSRLLYQWLRVDLIRRSDRWMDTQEALNTSANALQNVTQKVCRFIVKPIFFNVIESGDSGKHN